MPRPSPTPRRRPGAASSPRTTPPAPCGSRAWMWARPSSKPGSSRQPGTGPGRRAPRSTSATASTTSTGATARPAWPTPSSESGSGWVVTSETPAGPGRPSRGWRCPACGCTAASTASSPAPCPRRGCASTPPSSTAPSRGCAATGSGRPTASSSWPPPRRRRPTPSSVAPAGPGTADVAATTEGPTDAAGLATGDRVVLDPTADARLTAAGRDVVLTHELAHVAVQASVPGRAAGWLAEGYADHVGLRPRRRPRRAAARAAPRRGPGRAGAHASSPGRRSWTPPPARSRCPTSPRGRPSSCWPPSTGRTRSGGSSWPVRRPGTDAGRRGRDRPGPPGRPRHEPRRAHPGVAAAPERARPLTPGPAAPVVCGVRSRVPAWRHRERRGDEGADEPELVVERLLVDEVRHGEDEGQPAQQLGDAGPTAPHGIRRDGDGPDHGRPGHRERQGDVVLVERVEEPRVGEPDRVELEQRRHRVADERRRGRRRPTAG